MTDEQIAAAEIRGQRMLEEAPRTAAAHYDFATGRVVVDLVNGCTYIFPARLVRDLQGASQEDLARVEVDGVGFNLHWPSLDVDLYVPTLLSGVFGVHQRAASEVTRLVRNNEHDALNWIEAVSEFDSPGHEEH